MSGNENGAYELKHCGKIHRASEFSELKNWVLESRVTAEDSYRPAGTEKWLSLMDEPAFALILNPDSQWVVTMKSGEYRAHRFETIVKWAEEGRVTDDAVVEGPRTPPGGVRATALPALASNLRKQLGLEPKNPILRIDGHEFPAPDTETIRDWIRGSRVPIEAEISLKGKNWESVSRCGLFDLEDWPQAALGRIEEEALPLMPESVPATVITDIEPSFPEELHSEPTGTSETHEPASTDSIFDVPVDDANDTNTDEEPFIVFSGDSEMTIESVTKLKSLIKKKLIYSYDEIKHSTINEETVSVGEYLDSLKPSGKRPVLWIFGGVLLTAVAVSALDLFGIWEIIPWF